jgi:hypothetical protein
MDALAEVSAFPRILAPDTHKEDFDLRACGVTYFDSSNPALAPREWATQGKYDVGKDRADVRRRIIQEAFHVDLFRMFAELDKQMTAREVSERAAEKINQFSGTFTRLTNELFTPLLRRCFAMAYRAGLFGQPPKELQIPTRGGGAVMPVPEVSYSSRIALAIKSLENSSWYNVTEMWAPYLQLRPELMDNINFDRAFRDSVRNAGLPDGWLVDAALVEETREARAKKQAELERQQQVMGAAEAIGKAGSVKSDSMVGQMIGGLGGQNGANGSRQKAAPVRR